MIKQIALILHSYQASQSTCWLPWGSCCCSSGIQSWYWRAWPLLWCTRSGWHCCHAADTLSTCDSI